MTSNMTPVYDYTVIKAKTGDLVKLQKQLVDLGAGGWDIASTVYDPHGRGVIVFLKRGYWIPGPEAETEPLFEQAEREQAAMLQQAANQEV